MLDIVRSQTHYNEPDRSIKRTRRRNDGFHATILLAPFVGWWVIASGLPTLFGFFLGFFKWQGISGYPQFVGIQNYVVFFTNPLYFQALFRSVWLGLLCVATPTVVGFFIALLMNLPIKGKGIYRTIWYMPGVTAPVVVAQMFGIFTNPVNGILNNFLQNNLHMQPVMWNYSFLWGVIFIVLYSLWGGVGGSAILWLAGLQSIDPQLYEAASIDGANRWNLIRHITLPGLKPITAFIMITGFIGAVQIYQQVLFITDGGPFGQTEVLVDLIFKDAFLNFNLGMAGASSVVLLCVVFVFAIIYFRMITDRDIIRKGVGNDTGADQIA